MSVLIEKVGEGILATFHTGATVWWADAADAVKFANAVLEVAESSADVLDEMDVRGVFGHAGPRE